MGFCCDLMRRFGMRPGLMYISEIPLSAREVSEVSVVMRRTESFGIIKTVMWKIIFSIIPATT